MNILLIGLNPSSKNTNPHVPFEGTKSKVELDRWTDRVFSKKDQLEYANLVPGVVTSNSAKITVKDAKRCVNELLEYVYHYRPQIIVVLGAKTHDLLEKVEFYNKVYIKLYPTIYTWPHPSPRNRSLNDKKSLELWLSSMAIDVMVNRMCANMIMEDYTNTFEGSL